jgi:hypothetical protein
VRTSIGHAFDINLRQMIKDANLILLLLTKSSISSPWVNQEIGFAMAHGKPIWPLTMEKNIQPIGMLSTTQYYSLFDWSDPSRSIDRLVEVLREAPLESESMNYTQKLGLDQVIYGRIERTKFAIARLRELRDRIDAPLVIYIQAAFSSFAVSDDPMYREAGGHSDEYMQLLLQEHELLENLTDQPCTKFKMLLWPVRAYDDKYLAIRYLNLLNWMKKVKNDPTIEYACAQYLGPNRFIIPGMFCIAGYKLHHTSGYEMSIVTYDGSKIEDVLNEFNYVYNQASQADDAKGRAIQQIESMYKRVSHLSE